MKNIIQKFKNWLIYRLGGVPYQVFIDGHCGDGKCSKRCCTYCDQKCDRRDGYCTKFYPKFAEGTKEETARYKKAFDIQAD